MIHFKSPEERGYSLHYAEKLDDQKAIDLLESGNISSEEDAEYLSEFFWRMVEASIEDEENDNPPIYSVIKGDGELLKGKHLFFD